MPDAMRRVISSASAIAMVHKSLSGPGFGRGISNNRFSVDVQVESEGAGFNGGNGVVSGVGVGVRAVLCVEVGVGVLLGVGVGVVVGNEDGGSCGVVEGRWEGRVLVLGRSRRAIVRMRRRL